MFLLPFISDRLQKIIVGNFAHYYLEAKKNKHYSLEEIEDLESRISLTAEDMFLAYRNEMKELSYQNKTLYYGPGWVDLDNRKVYYYSLGQLTYFEY